MRAVDNEPRRQLLRYMAALPVAGLVAGCVELPGQGAPPRQFRLTPKSTYPESMPEVTWSLVVEEPDTQAALDKDRIALLRQGTELDYYADVTWSARAPVMVQRLMIESFKNSNKIEVVGNERLRIRPDFVLKPELREFQTLMGGGEAPRTQVTINAKLIQMPRRNVVGTMGDESIVEAGSEDIESVVAAFDEALGKVMKALVEWTLETGNAALAAG
ncbi:MAG: ABC-type transport auxiliary lipoprotein family protein [Alphaproteobacteria bacterium]